MNLNNFTFRGKRVFYGWIIVAALALEGMVSTALLGINFGLFINPMSKELGIKQAFFGWAQTARLAGSAASGYALGRLLDRHGARWPLMVAGILGGLVVVTMSGISAGWQLLALFAFMGMVGLQGSGSQYAVVSISRWFARDRGKAISRVVLGFTAGMLFIAPLTGFLIGSIGWRSTMAILGIGGGLIIALLALVIRREPEELGLLPDGDSPEGQSPERRISETQRAAGDRGAEYSWTRAEAVRSSTFWKLAVALGLLMFAISTFGLFRIPFFVSRGIDSQIVAYAISFEGIVNIAVTLSIGYVVPKFQARHLMAFSVLFIIGALLTAMATTQAWQSFLAMAFWGIGMITQSIVQSIIWPDYFGPRNIGSIRGLAMPLTMAFSFGGAPFAGMVRDTTGSFVPAWWIAIGLLVLAALLFLITRKVLAPPERKVAAPQPARAERS